MNAPNRFELYVLGEGENKLSVEEDTKIPNAATITINKEDHTLAGMLRSQLLLLPGVRFAGYKVPHPLEPRVLLKIQTGPESTPIQAVQEACKALILTLSRMREELARELDVARAVGPAGLDAFAQQAHALPDEGIAAEGMYPGPNGFEDQPPSGFGEWVQ